jgi:hypothetical protein
MLYLSVVVTVLLLLQTAVVAVLGISMAALVRRVGELQTRAEYVLGNAEPVLKTAQALMVELRAASGYIVQGVQHLTAISEMAKDEAADIKNLLGDSTALARREVERTRAHIDKVQDAIATTTDQFQRTTELVQYSVLQPAREFSYIMAGLRRGLEVLLAGDRVPVNRAYQDEELFI